MFELQRLRTLLQTGRKVLGLPMNWLKSHFFQTVVTSLLIGCFVCLVILTIIIDRRLVRPLTARDLRTLDDDKYQEYLPVVRVEDIVRTVDVNVENSISVEVENTPLPITIER
jgi:hypothetical protein